MARVSVGLPVYNGERYLNEALDSILRQTFEDFELIISDNASSDRTEEICKEYARNDKRIRYSRSSENLGVAWNFNRVAGLSTSEYFRWATADDLSAPDHIQTCVEVLDREQDAVLCYPKTVLIDENGEFIRYYEDNLDLRSPSPRERLHQYLTKVGLCNIHYGLMRSAALKSTRLVRNYPRSDVVLLGELSLYGTFVEIPRHLFYRRLHPQASSSIGSEERLQEFYDPKAKGKASLRLWRDEFEYLASCLRAPVTISQKAQIAYMLFRVGVSRRNELIAELLNALKPERPHSPRM
ncbi:MAG: glycosyltransferase [Syntrophorhabdales bacterium]|jgi:glycosyltransferase involved in cell wall biosynthesis